LHGHLAYIADKDLGLDMLFACETRAATVLAASNAADHLVGMTRPFWHAINGDPECWAGSLGVMRTAGALIASDGLPLATGDTYLPRKPASGPVHVESMTMTVPSGSAVLVTNVLGGYEHFRALDASVDGASVTPVASNDLSVLYLARAAAATWTLRIETSNRKAIDAVSIKSARQARHGTCGEQPAS
jgi:hypothetical protein